MSTSTTKSKRIVVISIKNDAHIPFVQKHLSNPMVVIDPQSIVDGTELTYYFDSDEVSVSYDHELLSNVSGVWYRKPRPILRRELVVKDEYKLYAQNSLEKHTVQLLTAFNDATWVSPYYNIVRANNKSLQLAVAKQVGFQIPDTVITSDEAVAHAFLDAHGQCITKPLAIAHPKVDGVQKVLLTTFISKDTATDLSGLDMAPSIFQEAVDIAMEVRAIVVGDKVYAACVESIPDQTTATKQSELVRDNRLGHYEGAVQIDAITDMPKDIVEKCVAHTKHLGLVFGAIDLIVDKRGTWWFLENNPNGQWAYIEDATNQPIGMSIAELLIGGTSHA